MGRREEFLQLGGTELVKTTNLLNVCLERVRQLETVVEDADDDDDGKLALQ